PDPLAALRTAAESRERTGMRRLLHPRPVVDAILDLASNDYLGLAHDPRVVDAAIAATRDWGTGSTGSRLVTGATQLHEELEGARAGFIGTQAALVFSSGYLANQGVISALSGKGALVVSDALTHASIVDACRLSRAEVVVVRHRDPTAVEAALARRTTG